MYTDVVNRKIFTTIDHSVTIKSIQLSFVPSEIAYRPDIPFVFVVHDKVSPTKQVWYFSKIIIINFLKII